MHTVSGAMRNDEAIVDFGSACPAGCAHCETFRQLLRGREHLAVPPEVEAGKLSGFSCCNIGL
jgi:hypothetical protein